jgi:GDP-mannose 6-dehydrogenase
VNIAIFGLGYVGTVAAACLSENGHKVVGVDPNETKVNSIQDGCAPVIEFSIEELISKNVARGLLQATTDGFRAVLESELILICVGTPSKPNGDLDLTYLRRVSQEIGTALAETDNFVTVAVRSTTLPGTMRKVVIPELEAHSGKTAGEGFGVGVHPEFLREGTAVADFYGPPKIVFASSDDTSRKRLVDINAGLDAPQFHLDFETAEMVKYSDNVWHGLKVAFANEVGSICKDLGIDGQDVMEVFCQDRKLNISTSYLKPGLAFGGSCLPKDIRALVYRARSLDLSVPVIEAILPSNESHVQRALDMIINAGHRDVGVLGLSFKPGTDDLRESPMVEIVERLIGKGYNIRIYDSNVNLNSLVGANRDYVLEHLPHIAGLLADNTDDVTSHARTVVVGNRDQSFSPVIERLAPDQCLIDFVRISEKLDGSVEYKGICW